MIKNIIHNKLFIPNLTAFIAGFCIMVVELAATRIIARYLGASIYTWTSVIGVVLTGIALGNYIGGRIADSCRIQKTLSTLFILASIGCVIVPVLNQVMGNMTAVLLLPLHARITIHVAVIFFLPSAVLGMISPVVAKFALDQGLATGKTIGNIYAWSSTGSITGVFVTGFYLISVIGTTAIIWVLAGILACVGVLYGVKTKLPYIWAALFILLVFLSFGSLAQAQILGQQLGLRQPINPKILYQTESEYSHIQVMSVEGFPRVRWLVLDHLIHSIIDMADPTNVNTIYQYPYIKFYAAISELLGAKKKDPSFLVVGGGAYIFPSYLRKRWPNGWIEVIEIDPAVTETARDNFGLGRDETILIHHADARTYINGIVRKDEEGARINKFDFIYSDAISGISVPYPLTTLEYNEKIRQLLAPDGVYVVTLIDSMDSGRFLGAVTKTLRESFEQVHVYYPELLDIEGANLSDTFVIVCSLKPIDLSQIDLSALSFMALDKERLELFEKNTGGIILTDDYAPVDDLLRPVVNQRGRKIAATKLTSIGDELTRQSRFDEAADYYQKAVGLRPGYADALNNFGNILLRQGDLEEAIINYRKAVVISPRFAQAYCNLGTALMQTGELDEAVEQLERALELYPDLSEADYNLGNIYSGLGMHDKALIFYLQAVESSPDFAEAHNSLGNAYFAKEELGKAIEHYKKAIDIRSDYYQAHNNLGTVLAEQGELDEAIFHYRQALRINPDYEYARKNLDIAVSQKQDKDSEDSNVKDLSINRQEVRTR
ncbi:MAG: fused MFS/spermidine synthase [Candidatus Omnitrophota bacterium]